MTKLGTILDQIDAGSVLLPEFQRGYVWNRDQVRGLMGSLYREYPVGSLLVWETDGALQPVRGATTEPGRKQLLLDGQQRVTTLYGIVRGRPPSFFEGDPAAFSGLRFHVGDEAFEFAGPVRTKADPRWVDVTTLFVDGTEVVGEQLNAHPDAGASLFDWVARLQRLRAVLARDVHVEVITGADKTVDVVIDIFNRVNSGGTKLSRGDLALARICAGWPDARPALREELQRWSVRGFAFSAEWLLRTVSAMISGRASVAALDGVEAQVFADAVNRTRHNVDHLLTYLGGRLGLDHDRVLIGKAAFPVLSRLLHRGGGRFADEGELDRALYWLVHATLQGRYSGAGETALGRDLRTVDESGVDGLIASLGGRDHGGRGRGGPSVTARDFDGSGRGSRAYPMLYLVSRVSGARDLVGGQPIGASGGAVEVHEIFPRPELVAAGHARTDGNAIANFAFLSPSTAAALAKGSPRDYLARCDPDVLASQWIPADPRLWEPGNYPRFLAARRELLAAALEGFLTALHAGRAPWRMLDQVVVDDERTPGDEPDPGADQLAALLADFAGRGYAQPEREVEILDESTGTVLASVAALWREGLQPGQGAAVALDLDPRRLDHPQLAALGTTVFHSVEALRAHAAARSVDAARPARAEPDAPGSEDPRTPGSDLEIEFAGVVDQARQRAVAELGSAGERVFAEVGRLGAVGAARAALSEPAPGDAFVLLFDYSTLDLSLEALAVDARFTGLFSEAEQAAAAARLEQYGWSPPVDGTSATAVLAARPAR